VKSSFRRHVLALALLAAATASADALDGVYFRLGVLDLIPIPQSGPVVLSNVTGTASLAVKNGPVAGSSVGMSSALLGAMTLGYNFYDQLSVETILALPPTITLTAKGTLANQSLATTVLGNVPTGIPKLGSQMGQTKAIPPVLTLTYRFLPGIAVRPYLGLGVSYLYSYNSVITNPQMTAVSQPKLVIPGAWGFVTQAGLDVRLWRQLYLTADFKYIAGLTVHATMENLVVQVPKLPLYGSARVGDASVSVTVNPIVLQGGLGWNF
jgi:outer membrane protein